MTGLLIISVALGLVLLGGLAWHERRRARWREQHEARLLKLQERAAQSETRPHSGQVTNLGGRWIGGD